MRSAVHKAKKVKKNGGQAIITAVVFFLIISLSMVAGIMVPLLRHVADSEEFVRDKQSYYSAEALDEDIIYRLNNNLNVPSSVALTLNGITATATVNSLLGGGTDQITTIGSYDTLAREISATVTQGTGASFNYGMQSGNGGFYLQGGSKVNGNIYSNGNITSTDGDTITGTAIAAGTSTIGGGSYVGAVNVGSGGVGDAWATTVSGASVAGTIYCQTGSNNNKTCNTSKGTPPSTSFPFSTSTIASLESDASSGGVITGDYNVNYLGATLGPEEITGNLTVGGGGTLTITGTLWVVGNVTVSGGGKIVLASSYGANSGAIVSNGLINLSGGSNSTGSGQAGSFLLLLTTSGSTSAITVNGGAGAVILVAQNGTANLSGGVSANQVTANLVSITGGSSVTYVSGLADVNFSSGPSGSWNVENWQEIGQ